MNIVTKSILVVSTLTLVACGGSATPSLWEDVITDSERPIQTLVKSSPTTVSRINVRDGFNVRSYSLDGDLQSEDVKDIDTSLYSSLHKAFEGHFYKSDGKVRFMKLDEDFDTKWSYQLGEDDDVASLSATFVSQDADEILFSSINSEGLNVISLLENGELTKQTVIDDSSVLRVESLLMSGEHIYAYGVTNDSPKTGVLYVLDRLLNLVAENDSHSIGFMTTIPEGIAYKKDFSLIAVDSTGNQVWEVDAVNNNSAEKLTTKNNQLYLYNSEKLDGVAGLVIGPFIKAYSVEGEFLWQHNLPSAGIISRVEETAEDRILVTYTKKTESPQVNSGTLYTRHNSTIKHDLLDSDGTLIRTVAEETYTYDESICYMGYCIPTRTAVKSGNDVNMGAVGGQGDDIISLSTTSQVGYTSVLSAY